MIDWKRLNPDVIDEFRRSGGKVAQFGELPLVILHTIGARSGKVREVPLIVVPDGERMFIFGTAAGASRDPDWVHNLRANPRIEVELGTERFTAEVVELPETEQRRRVEIQAAATPRFVEYMESAAPRTIPVFSIQRA